MIRNVLSILLSFILLSFDTPVYSNDILPNDIQNYTLKISKKFSKTYCNSIKFGISEEGAMNFALGETNKEFLKNKLNKFIDYKLLNKNILISLENNCQIYDFPLDKLKMLAFY